MSILELKNLTYKYEKSKKPVLSNISITFENGKLYAITGKSGSGKTTLLSLISGLDIPTSGTILYNEKNIETINRDDYRAQNIGVIFQGFNLLTNLTSLENILLSMNISEVNKKNKIKKAIKLLEKVGIDEDKANRKVLKLSGGEQQRIAIARALSHDPDILIADEPTGNLDGQTEKEIMTILKSLAIENNKCVIVVTHSNSVMKYADTIIQLSNINRK